MPLSRDTFQKLIDLFTPHFETLDQRRSLIGGAFFGTDVLAKVQLEGTPDEFTTRTVQMLIQHGEVESGTPAIIRLMRQLRGTVGVDKQAEIDTVIDIIRYELGANPSKPTGKPRIFISYSRADGEEFATDLRKRLEAENLTLWQDRARMEGGVGWWKQITDALDAVEFMVLVATPAAIASAVVKKEWRYARQQGVCVYPVQVPGLPLDFAAMPKWMRDSHFYNLDHEWETFVNYLKAPCTVPKVPFMAPDLPEHFVPRPDKFEPLKRQLLDADFDNPVAITTALKGAGGFGKTTLAAALCHDEDVQTAFDEGVLWVTLGETPNIINKLTVLYRALTGETPGFIEIEKGANKLAEKLADADVLLVIDDVWNPAHLRPFLRGGERVARLVTTRFANIAVDANADLLEVDEMTGDEAVQMLLAGIEPPDDLTPFKALAERLGEWALMLEVTNGTLRKRMAKGADLDGALAYVNKALDKRGVAGLKTGSNEAAVGVLDTSIEQVEPEDQPRLFELAIFAEDTDVPLTSIMTLWDMDDFDTEELIDQFDDLSFVRFDAERGTIRMHDVVREVLASRLDDPAAVHARLVDGWGYPTTLPDEYAWNNIAYHLIESGRADTLRELMLDLPFIQAKLAATNPIALATDAALLEKDDAIVRIMRSFWQVSAHVLSFPENHNQLYNQLIGRLGLHEANQPEIDTLLVNVREAAESNPEPQSILIKPTLDPAGDLLEHILTGHNKDVLGAIQLNDGRILSWSRDNTLRLWALNGTLLFTLEGHTNSVIGALELLDGRLLTWSLDKTLRLWSADGTPLTVSEEHTDHVAGGLILSSGRFLTWTGWGNDTDYTLRLWDTEGVPLAILEGHIDNVNGALELSDGQVLSWSNDTTLQMWDGKGHHLAKLEGHTGGVTGALELSDGRILSWSHDTTLRLWDKAGTPLATLKEHTDKVVGALELSDGRILSWSHDTTLRLWDKAGTPLATLQGHTGGVTDVLELSDGRLLSWCGLSESDTGISIPLWLLKVVHVDKSLRIWTSKGDLQHAFEGFESSVAGAIQEGNGNLILYSNEENSLGLWTSTGAYLRSFDGHTNPIKGVLELSGGRLLSWSSDNSLRIWNLYNSSAFMYSVHQVTVQGATKISGNRIISWSSDNTLRLWASDGTHLNTLEGHTEAVHGALELSDERILSWSSDNTLRLWASDGTHLNTLEGHTEAVHGALELSDKRILSWSIRSLRLWASDGQNLMQFISEGSVGVRDVVELHDGRLLSHSLDGTLRLWSKNGDSLASRESSSIWIVIGLHIGEGRIASFDGDHDICIWDKDGNELEAGTVLSDSVSKQRLLDELQKIQNVTEGQNEVVLEVAEYILSMVSIKENTLICRFISDSLLDKKNIIHYADGNIVTWGNGGKLHFLRPNRALRRLMGLEEDQAGDN